MQAVDVVIVGAGLVGLSTAYQLALRSPRTRVIVLDKELGLARHQSGRNSGVIHSGIYYRPGSLKAKNCRQGRSKLVQFCEEQGVRFELCGKVIVAQNETEVGPLRTLLDRGKENGVDCELIDAERLRELEPHARGVQAILVRDAGIVDFPAVCERLCTLVQRLGEQRVVLGAALLQATRRGSHFVLETSRGHFVARSVVNCAGLQSDRVARLFGQRPSARIVPFMGQFYELVPEARSLVKNLIYPVPDPRFPFLGVHATRTIHGAVDCGPNAVLALGREAYELGQAKLEDLLETLCYPGFLRLAWRHRVTGLKEVQRAFSVRAFAEQAQKLVPDLEVEHLIPAAPGIRAQAVGPDGALVDDFLIEESEGVVSVCNAPSPAATACLNIGELVARRVERQLSLV